MWTVAQILIDVTFALGMIVLACAHLAGRTTGAEIDVLREVVEHELDKIRGELDGGKR